MYKYILANAKFVTGKMLSAATTAGGFVNLKSMIVDLYSGD